MPAVAHAPAPEPRVEEPRADRPPARLFQPGGVTFEDVILGVWGDLIAGRHAECPVCGGSMSMIECSSCGSELS